VDNEEFYLKSPYLNIYIHPEELDYTDVAEPPEKSIRIDNTLWSSPNHEGAGKNPIPVEFLQREDKDEKLIHISLFPHGTSSLKLLFQMKLFRNLLPILAHIPHKFVITKPAQLGEKRIELPSNCVWVSGATERILPHVDLIITHGGNHRITEVISHGKPMIVLPLFEDQQDAAQRVHDKGYGIRLHPYDIQEAELVYAIDRLLHDEEAKAKLQDAAQRIKESDNKEKVCERIEELANNYKNQ